MKQPVKNTDFNNRIFAASADNFNELAVELFNFQYQHNTVYRQYCQALKINPATITLAEKIPFLPISFFKSHEIKTTEFIAEAVFESSGTTQMINSRHFIREISIYTESFSRSFQKFYGEASQKCVLGLLPSYLERSNSSLVLMVAHLIKTSKNQLSDFYLHNYEKLHRTIIHNELLKIPTLLIGVTYALLDFAEKYPMQLRNTIIMETGGMKGKRAEITREEVHGILQKQLGINLVHSEYGMTELLSQAYSKGNGIFHCPGWMKIFIREEDDPFHVKAAATAVKKPVTGLINVIDLANIYSCSFIATDDVGTVHTDGSFEVLGRVDGSDLRGCSLMVV